jgi:phosphoserine aminotransferase
MVPFNFQLELANKLTTFSAEQLDQLADATGFMRYQVRTFNHRSVIAVNIEAEPLSPEEIIGYSEDETFTTDEVKSIAAAIREYNSSRQLNFDQMAFDF